MVVIEEIGSLELPAFQWRAPCLHWPYVLLKTYIGSTLILLMKEQYALTEASYTLIRLLQVFSTIESRDSRPWEEVLGISLKNGNGAKVAFKAA